MYDYEVSVKLESHKNIAQHLETYLDKIRENIDISEDVYYQIVLCMVEAVNNAAEHGNKYDPAKYVHLHIVANHEYIRISVRDEGDGYIPDIKAAEQRINSDENMFATRGRGIFLINSLMHHLSYDISNGTEIIMQYDFDKKK